MHIKYIENLVNVQKCPNEPRKIPKLNTTLLLFYVDTTKILKAIRGNEYRFIPRGGTFPAKTIMLVMREALVNEKLIPKPTPNGTKIYHGMLMPLHDTMPSFVNFRRVLDLLEFKNQVSQCLRPSDGARVFEIH